MSAPAPGLTPAGVPAARRPVIAGLGMTELGRAYGRTARQFAADAVLALGDIDGLLVSSGVSGGVDLSLQLDLGLHDLGLLSEMQAFGSTAGAMVQVASMAVMSGMATPLYGPRSWLKLAYESVVSVEKLLDQSS